MAGISACGYFLFLSYMIFRVFRNISAKSTSLPQMSSIRRKFYSVSWILYSQLLLWCFSFGKAGCQLNHFPEIYQIYVGEEDDHSYCWGCWGLTMCFFLSNLTTLVQLTAVAISVLIQNWSLIFLTVAFVKSCHHNDICFRVWSIFRLMIVAHHGLWISWSPSLCFRVSYSASSSWWWQRCFVQPSLSSSSSSARSARVPGSGGTMASPLSTAALSSLVSP